MTDYISREAAYETLTEYYHHSTEFQHDALKEAIQRIHAADVRPVVRGKWEYEEQEVGGANGGAGTIWGYRCPRCDTLNVYKSNFCPNCGADMREES